MRISLHCLQHKRLQLTDNQKVESREQNLNYQKIRSVITYNCSWIMCAITHKTLRCLVTKKWSWCWWIYRGKQILKLSVIFIRNSTCSSLQTITWCWNEMITAGSSFLPVGLASVAEGCVETPAVVSWSDLFTTWEDWLVRTLTPCKFDLSWSWLHTKET